MTEEARDMVKRLREYITEDIVDFPYAANITMHMAADLIESLSAQLDAAVRDMGMTAHCDICGHHRKNGGDCIGFSECGQHRPRWKWRGAEVE